MIIDDARRHTKAAVERMSQSKDGLGGESARFWTLQEFLAHAEASDLTVKDRETIVDQSILILDQFYVHLPFKRARYAVDPVQQLRLIRSQLKDLNGLAFHREMLEVFNRLRDAHTFYGLPRPFRGALAFLPFRMKCFYSEGRRRFLVTSVMEGFEHPTFGLHAEITCWNGMPVERAITREAGHDPLGNAAARFVRGLNKMSNRSLSFSTPPAEDWVVLLYRPKDASDAEEEMGILLPWYVATDCLTPIHRDSTSTSVNESMVETAQARKFLWRRDVLAKEMFMRDSYPAVEQKKEGREVAAAVRKPAAPAQLQTESKFPASFEFRSTGAQLKDGSADPGEALRDPKHPEKRFGYVRIRSFDHNSTDQFIAEFGRILDIMQAAAPDGLIVDIRSNPGGAIDAAERALGLLVPGSVKPSLFHFLNTRLTQQIAESVKKPKPRNASSLNEAEWGPWVDDLLASVFSGGLITAGRPLTPKLRLDADPGQRYQGPITLITDALSYSSADLFAAGFQDNAAGQIIGVDENTGGGGANRWLHEELLKKLAGLHDVGLVELPGDAQLGLAIRRSSRAGLNSGMVIEDVGVRRDIKYEVTKNDLLNRDQDLLRFACEHLGNRPLHSLRILTAKVTSGAMNVTVSQENLHRLEFRVNGLPQCSFAATDSQPFVVPTKSLKNEPGRLLVNGFALEEVPGDDGPPELRLVVSDLLDLPKQETGEDPVAQ